MNADGHDIEKYDKEHLDKVKKEAKEKRETGLKILKNTFFSSSSTASAVDSVTDEPNQHQTV
jgi:hypothetical protein